MFDLPLTTPQGVLPVDALAPSAHPAPTLYLGQWPDGNPPTPPGGK